MYAARKFNVTEVKSEKQSVKWNCIPNKNVNNSSEKHSDVDLTNTCCCSGFYSVYFEEKDETKRQGNKS